MPSRRTRLLAVLAVLALALSSLLFPAPAATAAPIATLQLRVVDADTGQQVVPLSGDHDLLELPNGAYDFELTSDLGVARMRMQAQNADCPLGRLADVAKPDNPSVESDDDDFPRFRAGTIQASGADMTCDVVFNAWYENHKWAGHLFVDIAFVEADDTVDPEPLTQEPGDRRYDVTVGTDRSTAMDTDTPEVDEAAHGVRVYCPISHFSYDDPIVAPGSPDATHLHMFWGNTGTDADSTAQSLLDDPTSSCEGGTNNGSAYWMPAVFNAQGEVLLPESTITYYKSFGSGPSFARETIRPIPNGLQMIANVHVRNSGEWNIGHSRGHVRGIDVLRFNILFPQCVAVDASGDPVLSSPDTGGPDRFTTHLAYGQGGQNSNHCPSSHPYRIPQVIYNVRYALDADAKWTLSSHHGEPALHTNTTAEELVLHADYIAAWDEESMQRITGCNIAKLHMCQFRGAGGELRDQLAERFVGPDGAPIYVASDQLLDGADRTPFGAALTKMHHS